MPSFENKNTLVSSLHDTFPQFFSRRSETLTFQVLENGILKNKNIVNIQIGI